VQPRRLLPPALALLAALGIVGISFVPAWLAHDRVVLGEGARRVSIVLSAWRSQSLPVLGTGVALALLAGLLVALRPWSRSAALLPATVAAAGAGLLVAGLAPVSQTGHASSVTLAPAWALFVAIGLALVVLAVAASSAEHSRRVAGGLVLLVLLGGLGGWGVRSVELGLTEGTGEHYRQGSYTRAAAGGQPTETLVLDATTFRVGDRWSGRYEGSGRVVSIFDDPACPDVRGSYHVDAAGTDGAITWERIIDTCAGGKRAEDLSAGVWQRDP